MILEQEKQFIIEQRAVGKSFVQIGKALGRSEDSVRGIFNRAKNEHTRMEKKDGLGVPLPRHVVCRYCGKELTKIPKGAKKAFCSDRCRTAWYNERKRHTPYKLICEQCGLEFVAFGNPHKRFCSRQCYANNQKTVNRKTAPRQVEVCHD